MNTIYLSSEHPRWTLRSETDLIAARDGGLLTESHYLDMKRELDPGKGSNRELARDLASFAVDSGTLLIGFGELPDGSFGLSPQPLAGMAERVEQVAHMVCDPPLPIITQEIPAADDPGRGYLAIHVPASPAAPHMVDHRYLGRGDKTKVYLADAEVRRLHERLRLAETGALRLLDEDIARNPVPAARREQSHLFLLAEPTAGRAEMLLGLVAGPGWQQRLSDLVRITAGADTERLAERLGGFYPDLADAVEPARRPLGAAMASYNLAANRVLRDDARSEDVVELEVHEDGGLRIFMSRLSARSGRPDRDGLDSAEQVLLDVGAVLYVRRLLAVVAVAAEQGGYAGGWAIGVGATGLRGRRSAESARNLALVDGGPRYTDETYRRATLATYAELTQRPGAITGRLLGQFLRALGTDTRYASAMTDPTPDVPADDR